MFLQGALLGISDVFTPSVAAAAVALSPGCDPEVQKNASRIYEELEREETRFRATLAAGRKVLADILQVRRFTNLPPEKGFVSLPAIALQSPRSWSGKKVFALLRNPCSGPQGPCKHPACEEVKDPFAEAVFQAIFAMSNRIYEDLKREEARLRAALAVAVGRHCTLLDVGQGQVDLDVTSDGGKVHTVEFSHRTHIAPTA